MKIIKKKIMIELNKKNRIFILGDFKRIFKILLVLFVNFACAGISLSGENGVMPKISGKIELSEKWVVFASFKKEDGQLPADLLKKIPEQINLGTKSRKAVKLRPEMNKIDFTSLFGGQALENVAYVYIEINSPADQNVTLGMGADWWFQAWMDGKPLCDTMENGNVEWPPSITNHIVNVHLTKGKHILAVRFISGAGSSVFVMGGPDELRKIPLSQWKTVKPVSNNLCGTETVPNSDFKKGGKGIPWIPEGWKNVPAPFSFEGKELAVSSLDKSDTSLIINTTGKKEEKRKLYTRLSLIPGKQYKISYRARERRGGTVSISLRESINSGPVYFIHAIDSDEYTHYCFIENPRPYLLVESADPAHLILDEISIRPCLDGSKAFANWRNQRFPADNSFYKLSNDIVTEHIVWGKPHTGGNLKLLTLLPDWQQRISLELSQRFDFKCEAVFFGGPSEFEENYWTRGPKGDVLFCKPLEADLKKLEESADSILIDYINASAFPSKLVNKILEKVKNGTGLVIVGLDQPYYPYKDGRKREDALGKYKEGLWKKALCRDNITTEDTGYMKLGAVTNRDSEFYQYGKGRIAYLKGGDNMKGAGRSVFETRMAYIGKAVLWAAHHEPKKAITSVVLPGETQSPRIIQRDMLPAVILVNLKGAAEKGMKLNLRVNDDDGGLLYKKETEIPEGSTKGSLELPKLKTGTLYLNIQLSQAGKVYDWETVLLKVDTKAVLKDILLEREKLPYYMYGEAIRGKVHLERDLMKNEHLEITLSDIDGHLWYKQIAPVKERESSFSFDSNRLIFAYNTLKARVFDLDGTLSESEKPVIITYTKDWYAKNFNFGLWIGPKHGYLGTLLYDVLRKKYGVNFFLAGNQLAAAENAIKANIKPIFDAAYGATTFGKDNKIIGDNNAPERKLCLSSEELKTKISRIIKLYIRQGASYGPLAYFLDHEVDLLGYINRAKPETDICFSKSCLADLRIFLKKEYKDLSALNKSWNTDFKNWDEVKPIVLSEALENGQISRWIDHRRHMDRVWTDLSLFRIKEVRKYDPNGDGMIMNLRSGPTVNNSFSGVDYWQLLHEAVGGAGLPCSYQKAFTGKGHNYLFWKSGAFWYPRDTVENMELARIRLCRQPWLGLLFQCSGYLLYTHTWRLQDAPLRNDVCLVNPDLTIPSPGNALAETILQIRSGIDTFVLNCQNDDSGIGLYYSRASEHACTAWQKIHQKNKTAKEINPRRSQFALWDPSIRAINRSFRSVAYGEVADGILQKGDIKLLIIPFSQAISLKEAEEIRNFVRRGGAVIADIRPAVSDEHGNLYGEGLLDDVFGVKHDPSWKSYEPKRGDVKINLEKGKLHFSNVILGPELKLSGAKITGKADVPVYLVNNYGKGKAILLNFYMEPKTETASKDFERLIEIILTSNNIPRLFDSKISDIFWFTEGGEKIPVSTLSEKGNLSDLSATEDPGEVEGLMFENERTIPQMARLVNGNMECIGLGCDYHEHLGNGMQTVYIRPQKRGHVYDLRTNAYLGEEDAYEVTMPLEGLIFHAIVPYQIQKPLIDVKIQKNTDGFSSIVSSAVVQPKAAFSEKHVIRFKLVAPDGKEWTDFAVNKIVKDGTASHTFILPLNAPGGEWKIIAREAISGLEAVSCVKN